MQFKSIFILKEIPARVFSWQLYEIFNNNFFKEKKKGTIIRKKALFKKRGSDIHRKSNYASFYLTSPRSLHFSTAYRDNGLCVALSVEKNQQEY